MEYEIKIYATEKGNEPFREWVDSLKNFETQALVFQRLQRIKLGNFGDCKPIEAGLWEFRIHHRAGIRIYYALVGQRLLLIIGGGDKQSQQRDITKAKKHIEDFDFLTHVNEGDSFSHDQELPLILCQPQMRILSFCSMISFQGYGFFETLSVCPTVILKKILF
jgi:putative addiction module killer protein